MSDTNETTVANGEASYLKLIGDIGSYAYTLTGLPVFIGSVLLLIPIIYHRALRKRKEYMIIAGLVHNLTNTHNFFKM